MSIPSNTLVYTVDRTIYFIHLFDVMLDLAERFPKNKPRILIYKTINVIYDLETTYSAIIPNDQVKFVNIVKLNLRNNNRRKKYSKIIFIDAGVYNLMS